MPISNRQVQETGDFELDGVTFPAAEIQVAFMDPAADDEDGGALLAEGSGQYPETGNLFVRVQTEVRFRNPPFR